MKQKSPNRFVETPLALAVAVLAFAVATPVAPAQAQQPAAQAQAAPAGNLQNGKTLYVKDGCYQCHGYSGQGGPAGARLSSNPISLTAFVQYVRQPRNQMPPYTDKVISDQELADIYAFIKSIPKPPDPKTIPLLNAD